MNCCLGADEFAALAVVLSQEHLSLRLHSLGGDLTIGRCCLLVCLLAGGQAGNV